MRTELARRAVSVVVGVVAVAGCTALSSTAAGPPNFDIHATGAVGFDCWAGGGFPACNPFIFRITGNAPAYGTHVGSGSTFSTVEEATPISATDNVIDGHAVVTATNGDQICIHYTGISPAPVGDFFHPGHLNDDLAFTIEDYPGSAGNYPGCTSSGHFSDAAGSGRLTASGTVYYDGINPTIVSSELKGTISMHPH
jgi:hypothetical protein